MSQVKLKVLSNYLPVFTKKAIYGVQLDSVLYIESQERKVLVSTKDEGPAAHVFYNSLQSLMFVLPKHFVQCHKSFVVNLKQVVMLTDRCFLMQDGSKINISASYYASVKLAFKKFLMS